MAAIESIAVSAYQIPTDAPESDGTLAWQATTLVLVELKAGGSEGLGHGYADKSTAGLMHETLAPLLVGQDAWDTGARWLDMVRRLRNLGGPGIAAMAVSVLDTALWDWKARRLGVPLARLLGMAHTAVQAYGSGGFTSQDVSQLQAQLAGWVEGGFTAVKMKVGREPASDVERVAVARQAIGPHAELMVDANGAYAVKQALHLAEQFAEQGVVWFEEPVSSDDLQGLHLMRQRAPARMEIAAGEYGYDVRYFRRMLAAGAVDVLQADATRCGGVTGFLKASAVCEAFGLPLSSHCAPALHASLLCAAPTAKHLEYFHDHVRIEAMLFDGGPVLAHGGMAPDLSRAGLGLTFKHKDAACFKLM